MRIIPFTKSGLDEFKKQLEDTISKRPDAVKSLQRGREMGDLSENGLYKAAKMELGNIDRQIRYLKNLIKFAKVSIPNDNLYIQIGHKVIVQSENGKKDYYIVGEYEADPKNNKISNKSPIGYSLMNKKIGDRVIVNTPKGSITYLVTNISL